MVLKVKKFDMDAKLPEKAHETSAGYDVFTNEEFYLLPKMRVKLKLGIAVDIPPGHCLLMQPRSGLSVNNGLGVLANVIDEEYTGQIHAVVVNHGGDPIKIEKGMKICQMLLIPVVHAPIQEVADITKVTTRGDKAFGSSGL